MRWFLEGNESTTTIRNYSEKGGWSQDTRACVRTNPAGSVPTSTIGPWLLNSSEARIRFVTDTAYRSSNLLRDSTHFQSGFYLNSIEQDRNIYAHHRI
jgi:hypothetical protein